MLNLESLDSAFAAFSSPHLWAYLDPGTGSMVFQILVAGMLSSAFFLKSWMRSVRDGLLMIKSRNS